MDVEDIILLLAFDAITDKEAALFIMILDEEHKIPEHLRYGCFGLNAFSDVELTENFCFEKTDIHRLCEAMSLKSEYHSHTKLKWQNIEGLCMLIRCLAYPNHLCELRPLFGHHVTEMSVIINCMTQVLLNKFGHKLLDLWENDWFDPDSLARAVQNKGAVMSCVWGFLDGTVGAIARLVHNQREFFSGHK